MAEIENLKIGTNGTIHIVGNENIITEEWEASKTYVKDKSYVIREHKLYVCNVTHTSTSPFDPTKWTEITVIGAIDNALDMTATASGAIATFESEYALPLRDLEIEINCLEQGDGNPKSPSNPYTLTGFTSANISIVGANLYDSSTVNSGKFLNASGVETSNANYAYSDYITVKGGATYYYPSLIAGVYAVFAYDSSKTLIDKYRQTNHQYTLPENACYVRVNMLDADKNTNFFNYPATDTAYHAYNSASNTTAISWQDEAGTVYGGSLDVTSGVLTVTHGGIDLGDLTWSNASGNLSSSSGIATDVKAPSANTQAFNGLCSVYEVAPRTGISDKQIAVQTNGNIVISDTGIAGMTGAQIKTYLTGFILVYELATPQTYQLTPAQITTLANSVNNVFTDTNGDTSLEYYTKRGEQTVRIAEGTAKGVINNSDFNTLNTTSKKITGAINELDADKFDSANRVSTGSGTFAGLLNSGDHVWLIVAQRLSTNSTIVLVAHKQGTSYYFKEIVKDTGMAYNYNQDNGSVVITYGGQTTGVYGGAYRLV